MKSIDLDSVAGATSGALIRDLLEASLRFRMAVRPFTAALMIGGLSFAAASSMCRLVPPARSACSARVVSRQRARGAVRLAVIGHRHEPDQFGLIRAIGEASFERGDCVLNIFATGYQ
jgi:hypothetical protein